MSRLNPYKLKLKRNKKDSLAEIVSVEVAHEKDNANWKVRTQRGVLYFPAKKHAIRYYKRKGFEVIDEI